MRRRRLLLRRLTLHRKRREPSRPHRRVVPPRVPVRQAPRRVAEPRAAPLVANGMHKVPQPLLPAARRRAPHRQQQGRLQVLQRSVVLAAAVAQPGGATDVQHVRVKVGVVALGHVDASGGPDGQLAPVDGRSAGTRAMR